MTTKLTFGIGNMEMKFEATLFVFVILSTVNAASIDNMATQLAAVNNSITPLEPFSSPVLSPKAHTNGHSQVDSDVAALLQFPSERPITQIPPDDDLSRGRDGFSTTEDYNGDLSTTLFALNGNGTEALSGWSWLPMTWPWYKILLLISGIVGLIGNFLVILVLFQRRAACRPTDTLINGLAIADFLTSIFIIPLPQETRVPISWVSEIYCKIISTSFCLWVSITASTYILMAISVERYIAVAFPLHFNRLISRRRVSIVIAIIWLVAFISVSWAFMVEIVDPVLHKCQFVLPSANAQFIIGVYWFSIRLVIPMLTMIVSQTLIARELQRHSQHFKNNTESATTKSPHLLARNRVLRMMFEVILIYIVCWAPNQIAYLGYILGFVSQSYINSPLHHFLTVLGFYNSCANPIIYTARHPQFRSALKGVFTGKTYQKTSLFGHRAEGQSVARTENPSMNGI